MIEITVKDVWAALTPAEKEDACVAFCEKSAFSKDLQPQVFRELAAAMNLREVALKRLPVADKARYLRWKADGPVLRHIRDHILRSWMVIRKNAMLVCFVEAQALKHTGGIVADDVQAPDLETVKKAVRAIRDQYPPREVALYLGVMLATGGDIWAGLREAVEAEFPSLKDVLVPAPTT